MGYITKMQPYGQVYNVFKVGIIVLNNRWARQN